MNLNKSALAAIVAGMLFLLRNPSKFRWTDADSCLVGWAVKLKTGKNLFKLADETGKSVESAAAEALGMDYGDLYNFMYNTSPRTHKQKRREVRDTVLKAINLIVGDKPKDYQTALLAVLGDILVKPSGYNQSDPFHCIVGLAAAKLGVRFQYELETLTGVTEREQDKIFLSSNWPDSFEKRRKALRANGRFRDFQRNSVKVAVERTLHYIITGE